MYEGEDDGGDINPFSELREQLIHASQDGDPSKVKYLVEVRHVDPHSCRDDEHDATPLHWASFCGHVNVVRYLVEERNCNIECRNKHGNTPLHCAALQGRLDVVQYLISEGGCDPMSRGQYTSPPLHHTCNEDTLDVHRNSYPCRYEDDATPLHLAAFNGYLSVVRVLVEDYLCDPGVRDRNRRTPADWAQSEGQTQILSYLSFIEKTVSSEYNGLALMYM